MDKPGFLSRLKVGLGRSRERLTSSVGGLFSPHRAVDPAMLDELEERLLAADLGVAASRKLVDELKKRKFASSDEVLPALKTGMVNMLPPPRPHDGTKPWVTLFVGVNGSGKTTTVAKVGRLLKSAGHGVILVAADTFRAAAGEQLEIWAERLDLPVIRQRTGSDPAALVFDGIRAARAQGIDDVLVDTAGRLQTKRHLMAELEKVRRVAAREQPGAPHSTLIVLDATVGQNGLVQCREFHQAVPLTGIVLTKMEGTAKGGIVFSIAEELRLPVEYIGVGEKGEDLLPFSPAAFVEALFEND